MIKLQVTLVHKDNTYRPISTLVEIESMDYYTQHKAEVQRKALEKMAHQRKMLPSEIVKQGFTKVKTREYDIDKIKAEQEYKYKVNLIKKIQRDREARKEKEAQANG